MIARPETCYHTDTHDTNTAREHAMPTTPFPEPVVIDAQQGSVHRLAA
ncbi:MAG TPA: hypothetical protein VHB25_03530 [Gemmatimonadaceae bacterium]|nr:hypothetical protein [Gemmatimonadaceae bacterium]